MRVWLTEYGDLGVFDRSAEAEWKRQCVTASRRALRALNEGAQAALFWDAFDNYHEHDKAIYYHGLLRYEDHRFAPKKRYYAAKQLYRFVPPGAQRIAATTEAPGLTVSAFRTADSVVLVGVKEGGADRVQVALPASRRRSGRLGHLSYNSPVGLLQGRLGKRRRKHDR